jgi:hypothetical protein
LAFFPISLEFSSLILAGASIPPRHSSSIVINFQLFKDLSSTIALKDRDFVSVSSSVRNCTVEMNADDGSVSYVSWILLYRASLSGYYRAADFHQACNGMGNCVVVVKAENGKIAAAYNEDGFTSAHTRSLNHSGFIVSVADDGIRGEIFNRNDQAVEISNFCMALCLGVVHMIPASQTIATRKTYLGANLVCRMEEEGRGLMKRRCLVKSCFECMIMRCLKL